MSEARERLIEAGGNALWGNVLPGGEGDWGIDDTMDDAKSTLDAFLSRPDDLVELLVREHGIESVRTWVEAMVEVTRRTEGGEGRTMSDITPDALQALADDLRRGVYGHADISAWMRLAHRALRAAADHIKALEANRPACCHEMQTFYDARGEAAKAIAERDEAVAVLRDALDGCADWPAAQAFLARLEAEG